MKKQEQINLGDAGVIEGPGPVPRFKWQCRCLALLTNSSQDEIHQTLMAFMCNHINPFIEATNALSKNRPGDLGRPIIEESNAREALCPVLVRVINEVAWLPPLGNMIRSLENKETLLKEIQQDFDLASKQLPSRFESMLNERNFHDAFNNLCAELRKEALCPDDARMSANDN